jgi:hypothetical protein
VIDADRTGVCGDLLAVIALLSLAGVPRRLLRAMGKTSPAAVDKALGQLATSSLLTYSGETGSTVTAHGW